MVSSMTGMNANESKIKVGEYFKCVLAPQDFGLEAFGDENLYIGINLTDELPVSDGKYETYQITDVIKLTPEAVETVTMEGSYAKGFTAKSKK